MLKVLFVGSGNRKTGISTNVQNQGESLKELGADVEYFEILGKGLSGYLKNIVPLRRKLINGNYHLVHAHFAWSSYVASLAGAKPLVVSLMGTDVKTASVFHRIITYLFHRFFWNVTIVKSDDMKRTLGLKNVEVIPNGVDFKKFRPMDRQSALKVTKWDPDKQHILFAANPSRPEKNFSLAKSAVDLVDDREIELHTLDNVPNDQMSYLYNSSDVVLLTSLFEGSPNVIKEAMACNIPIVSCDVGDVRSIIQGTNGCFIANRNVQELSTLIKKALSFTGRTNGRTNIKDLNSVRIAQRIIDHYQSLLN